MLWETMEYYGKKLIASGCLRGDDTGKRQREIKHANTSKLKAQQHHKTIRFYYINELPNTSSQYF